MINHTLSQVRGIQDLPELFRQLDYDPDYCPIGDGAAIVARWKGFLVIAATDRYRNFGSSAESVGKSTC